MEVPVNTPETLQAELDVHEAVNRLVTLIGPDLALGITRGAWVASRSLHDARNGSA